MTDLADYVPRQAGAKMGSRGVNVRRLQNYLTRFGYLDSSVLDDFGVRHTLAQPSPDSIGEFDEQTEEALRKFQQFHGLEVTGELDEPTVALMEKPRCGFPDTAEYVLQGNKWTTTNLRYGYQNFTGDVTQAQVRAALTAAFGYWSAVTPLTFTEVPFANNPEIRIRFVTGDHGDGSPFDGPGGVLAHAFYPPPNGGDLAGDAHFDDAENWSINLPPSGVDLYTVAAHEIGHSLGLAHSTVSGALMYPYYGGPHRFLDQDDINGIQALYGAAQWHHNKVVQRLYTSHHSQNAWALVQDLGWRKIETGSADGVTNMFGVLAAARGHNIGVSVFIQNNTIREMYL
jgi:peptidoglycan hydrolase-like protein with peptidoglycan-binding domain